ncbi:hypothetical protein CYMTET_44812 [Cymbomonas tetramitiformis]|uniref:Uncharacterized protein n=1 Tax=Cymbomonas tetramitiformis TaxID=36881 RepID=A0AAE0EYN4_9CHLO|nr:hypothetical protein CYMTET_44812 [Cymbomonas tetramitiformis]
MWPTYTRKEFAQYTPAQVSAVANSSKYTLAYDIVDTSGQQLYARSQQRHEAPADAAEKLHAPTQGIGPVDTINQQGEARSRQQQKQISPTCLTLEEMADVLNIAAVRAVRWSPTSARPIPEEALVTESDATNGSATDADAAGTTHVDATDGDATGDSVGNSDSTHTVTPPMPAPLMTVMPPATTLGDSDSTHVSATDADTSTTHVSATDGEAIISDITMDSGVTHVSATDIDGEDTLVSAADHTGGQDVHIAGLCALESHALPEDRHCKHIRKDGTIKWRYAARSLLASTLAACAKRCNLTIRTGAPMQVTLADGSVKTTGEVAHSKFKAHTAKGVGFCESNMMLRVLPLGIQVDVVLGGRCLRSLSPVTLDYAGHMQKSLTNTE